MSGGSRVLQALSRDKIIPFIGIFGKGYGKGDEPLFATALTFVLVFVNIFIFLLSSFYNVLIKKFSRF